MKKKPLVESLDVARYLAANGINPSEEVIVGLLNSIQTVLDLHIKLERNRARIVKNDGAKDQVAAREILTDEQISKLPRWVRENIDEANIIGTSKQVIQVPNGKKYHMANTLNDLSGGEWTFFLNSVIATRYPTSGPESYAHHLRKIHPSPKPPQLMQAIIEFFTKENELVLDYFMGVGGTLLGASLANRRAVGIDLSEKYIQVYKESSKKLGLTVQKTLLGDSLDILREGRELLDVLAGEKISLIAIDPPYGDMMNRAKTGESAKNGKDTSPTPFTHLANDLGNLDLEQFYPVFKNSVELALPHLKEKGHVIVFIKDMQPEGQNTNLLHARVIEDLNSLPGLKYLGTKIWADQSVNLYPYGYPYSYVANQIHQYIMIFRKTG
jgi:DNA modification methylase